MTYELLKIAPYSCNRNIGWEDCNLIDWFSATKRSLRWQFARKLKKLGVDISGGVYKFVPYGEYNEHMELVKVATDIPLWAAVCAK